MNIVSKSNKTTESFFSAIDERNLKNSYSNTTNDIEITVWPEFIDNQKSVLGNLFVWAYHVRIDNRSSEIVTLLNRHWKIIDEQGAVQEIDGEGVVGEKPTILPGESFQYSSGVHLKLPSGIMGGHYQMQRANGELFEAKIPSFSLDTPLVKNIIN